MPKVRVVTPTDPQTATILAFANQLMVVDQWSSVDYRVYSASDDTSNLDTVAQYAVDDRPDAILACGSMAASKVQSKTTTCPIIMVGGLTPPNAQSNLTGFTINGIAIAQHHLDHLNTQTTTIIYDNTNDPSMNILNSLDLPQGTVTLAISNPGVFGSQNITTKGFMLIPNAMYYSHRKHIIGMVDNNANVTAIYYPEREYKDESTNPNKVKVHGHDLPGTFRDAADIVSSILHNGPGNLQPPKEGRKYKDD
jgi:hypothetical protein